MLCLRCRLANSFDANRRVTSALTIFAHVTRHGMVEFLSYTKFVILDRPYNNGRYLISIKCCTLLRSDVNSIEKSTSKSVMRIKKIFRNIRFRQNVVLKVNTIGQILSCFKQRLTKQKSRVFPKFHPRQCFKYIDLYFMTVLFTN